MDQYYIAGVISELQNLGMLLKAVVFRLPDSVIKQYLMLEVSKVIELKTAVDFYYLHNKISRMMDMAFKWNLDKDIIKLLNEISVRTSEIVKFIEKEV